ncbi:MAG: transglutaminase TgpA family protein [Nitrospinales bacterium]
MSIRICFIIFNYFLAALAIGCLSFIETFSLVEIAVILTGLSLCMGLEIKKTLPIKPPAGLSLLKVGLIILPLVYFTIPLSLVDFTAYALVFILITRFIFKTELNDFLFGYLIAIVCMLAGAIFTQGLIFGIIFLSFYVTLCWNLVFYNMIVERTGSNAPPEIFKPIGEKETTRSSLFILTGSMVTVSLVFTAAIFITFPRLGLGFMSISSASSPATGFSNTVQLGDVGKIKQNENVVMRIEYRKNSKPYRPISKVLWRGVTLDFYKDQKWTTTMPRSLKFRNHSGSGASLFSSDKATKIVQQDVYMEAFDSPVIFTHGIPMKINGSFRSIEMDQSYALRTTDKKYRPKRFTMISDIGNPSTSYTYPVPREKSGFGRDQEAKIFPERFLQLPELAPRIVKLSNDVAGTTGSEQRIAKNILRFLRNNYGYSLEMVSDTGMTGLEEFLFVNKKGHCEYFASAMAILLRLNDIPARIVNGFSGGEWNEMGNYMIVRQKHAHSWVEAYLPGEGWMVFDPTPPDPGAVINPSNRLSHTMDLMRLYWQRYVVKYTFKDQAQIFEFFNRGGRDTLLKIKSLNKLNKEKISAYLRDNIWLVISLAAILLIFLIKKYKWFSTRMSFSKSPYEVTLYQEMLNKCVAHGIIKKSDWTHIEFLSHITTLSQEKVEAINRITQFYELNRFGARQTGENERKEMQNLLRVI